MSKAAPASETGAELGRACHLDASALVKSFAVEDESNAWSSDLLAEPIS